MHTIKTIIADAMLVLPSDQAIEGGKALADISEALDIHTDEQVVAMILAAASVIQAASNREEVEARRLFSFIATRDRNLR